MAHVSSACDTGAAVSTSFEMAGSGRARLDLLDVLGRVVPAWSVDGSAVIALGREVRGV